MSSRITRRSVLRGAVGLAGAAGLPNLLQCARPNAPLPTTAQSRPKRALEGGVVVSVHPAAGEAGLAVLRDGGNAVDAAAAAIMALCVTAPSSVGFGGYAGSMIVYLAGTGRVEAVDADSRAPLAYRPELYAGKPELAEHGYLAATVPGVVANLDTAIKRYGRRSWAELSRAAVRLAEEGQQVSPSLAKSLRAWARTADDTSRRAIFPDGNVPKAGEVWRQPDLARLIRQLADDPSQFYRGEISKRIVRQVQANGGILSEEDFRRGGARVTEPLHISYRGHELYTPSLPSGGLATLSILKTLEHFDLARPEPWSAAYDHLLIEAMKLCWRERAGFFGDPEFVKVPIAEMLSDAAAVRRAEQIEAKRVPASGPVPMLPRATHTVNVLVVDRDGNVVSWTATHGSSFGSHVAIDGLGLFIGHGMSRFTLDPQSPNAPQPGKRVDHNMSPLLVLQGGSPVAAIGMPGGTRIPTVTAQIAVNLLDFHAAPAEAVTAPRLHVEAEEPVFASANVAKPVVTELTSMGHRVLRVSGVGGFANAAVIDPAGHITAACSASNNGIRRA
jgi:gamma-glutamyltranspeptidase / glutathione hydrolase